MGGWEGGLGRRERSTEARGTGGAQSTIHPTLEYPPTEKPRDKTLPMINDETTDWES